MWGAVILVLLAADAIPIGTCGYFEDEEEMYQVIDYITKMAFERGFLKPASTNFSIELYPVDTKCDGPTAAEASLPLFMGVGAQKGFIHPGDGLPDQPPVVAISGCSCSGSSRSVSMLADNFEVPVVSGAATSLELSNKDVYEYFSRVIPTDDMQSLATAKLIQDMGWTKVYGISSADVYGKGLSEALGIELKKADVEYYPKSVSHYFENDPTKLNEAIDRFLAEQSNRQRVFAIFAHGEVTMAVLRALDARGFVRPETVFLLADSACDLTVLNLTDKSAFYAREYPDVVYWNDGYDWDALFARLGNIICVAPQSRGPLYESEEFKSFFTSLKIADFQAAGIPDWAHNEQGWYEDLSMFGAAVYYPLRFDALSAIIYAIGRLKADGVAEKDIKGKKLLDTIRKMQFEGLSGTVGMDAKGDRLAPYSIMNLQSAGLVKVGTYNSAQGSLTMTGSMIFSGGSTTAPNSSATPCSAGEQDSQDGFGCDHCPPGTANPVAGAKLCSPCKDGFYSPVAFAQQCRPCLAGSFQGQEGQTSCVLAGPGHFQAEVAQGFQQPCPAGKFMDEKGAIGCDDCPAAKYSEQRNSTECRACPPDMTTMTNDGVIFMGADQQGSCICRRGTFLNDQGLCEHCSSKMVAANVLECAGGDAPPRQKAGYKVIGPNFAYTCPSEESCPEGLWGGCSEGATGIACSECLPGYSWDSDACGPCGSGAASTVPTGLIMALLGGGVLMVIAYRLSSLATGRVASNAISGIVCISLVMMLFTSLSAFQTIDVPWMEPFRTCFRLVNHIMVDLSFLTIKCQFETTVVANYAVVGCIPAMVAGMCVAIVLTQRSRIDWRNLVNAYLGILQMILLPILLHCMRPFQFIAHPFAEGPDGFATVLMEYPHISVGSGEHNALIAVGLLSLLLNVCTFLAACMWAYQSIIRRVAAQASALAPTAQWEYVQTTLLVSERELYKNSVFIAFRFLFFKFKPRYYFWGLILLVRTIILGIVPAMFSLYPDIQLLVLGCCLLAILIGTVNILPWKIHFMNICDCGMLSALILLVLLGVSCLRGFGTDAPIDSTRLTLGVFIFVSVWLFMAAVYTAAIFLQAGYTSCRSDTQAEEIAVAQEEKDVRDLQHAVLPKHLRDLINAMERAKMVDKILQGGPIEELGADRKSAKNRRTTALLGTSTGNKALIIQNICRDALSAVESDQKPSEEFQSPGELTMAQGLKKMLSQPEKLLLIAGKDIFKDVVSAGMEFITAYLFAAANWWTVDVMRAVATNKTGNAYLDAYTSVHTLIQAKEEKGYTEYKQKISTHIAKCVPYDARIDQIPDKAERVAELYVQALQVLPHFKKLIMEVAKLADGTALVATPKSPLRVCEKIALRPEKGVPWDVIRAQIEVDSMEKVGQAISLIVASTDTNVHRIKDRFSNPHEGGWADCSMNVTMRFDDSPVMCEIQIVHDYLMMVREGMKQHDAYDHGRFAAELLATKGGGITPPLPWSVREKLDKAGGVSKHTDTATESV